MEEKCQSLTDADLEKLRYIKCNKPWLWAVIDTIPISTKSVVDSKVISTKIEPETDE